MQDELDQQRALIHAQTARVRWHELERHFARGVVIRVAGDLDLIEVASRMVADDEAALQEWMTQGRVAHVTTEDARDWSERDPGLWAVITAPWILVQEAASG